MSDEDLIDHRLEQLEKATERHGDILEQIRDSLVQLVQVQTTLTQISKQSADHESRLRVIEQDFPVLNETRRWLVAAVGGSLAAIAAAVAGYWIPGGHG